MEGARGATNHEMWWRCKCAGSLAPSATRAHVNVGAGRITMVEGCRRREGVVEGRGGDGRGGEAAEATTVHLSGRRP